MYDMDRKSNHKTAIRSFFLMIIFVIVCVPKQSHCVAAQYVQMLPPLLASPLLCNNQILLKLRVSGGLSAGPHCLSREWPFWKRPPQQSAVLCLPPRERVSLFPDWRLRPNELGRFAQKLGVEMKQRSPRSGDGGGEGGC